MTSRCATCDPSYLDDPGAMLRWLAAEQLLVPGPDLLVVVSNGSSEVLGVTELVADLETDGGGELVAAAAARAGGGPRDATPGPRHKTAHLIRRRAGRTVPLPLDTRGWTSWLNASNWMDCYVGDWYLVTDNGWRSLLGDRGPAGVQPRLRTLRSLRA